MFSGVQHGSRRYTMLSYAFHIFQGCEANQQAWFALSAVWLELLQPRRSICLAVAIARRRLVVPFVDVRYCRRSFARLVCKSSPAQLTSYSGDETALSPHISFQAGAPASQRGGRYRAADAGAALAPRRGGHPVSTVEGEGETGAEVARRSRRRQRRLPCRPFRSGSSGPARRPVEQRRGRPRQAR